MIAHDGQSRIVHVAAQIVIAAQYLCIF